MKALNMNAADTDLACVIDQLYGLAAGWLNRGELYEGIKFAQIARYGAAYIRCDTGRLESALVPAASEAAHREFSAKGYINATQAVNFMDNAAKRAQMPQESTKPYKESLVRLAYEYAGHIKGAPELVTLKLDFAKSIAELIGMDTSSLDATFVQAANEYITAYVSSSEFGTPILDSIARDITAYGIKAAGRANVDASQLMALDKDYLSKVKYTKHMQKIASTAPAIS